MKLRLLLLATNVALLAALLGKFGFGRNSWSDGH